MRGYREVEVQGTHSVRKKLISGCSNWASAFNHQGLALARESEGKARPKMPATAKPADSRVARMKVWFGTV